ncbi:bifunctional precorrin-2 dehydrogenase/sirohydrochlorin ferrochelatase [Halococcus sp. IIIV-5B]|uniref:precorrin-2 dehydrogenase/sirohydrochlorin ferrochelatase family protein n=1 Tax=Halococcus sp. IIIV-5B TaxID=2321230 RepID=UPI000E75FE6B|nr:bifunctional precorrin-2 dehydrogenase/sirohydrochlorin ferrochelatase [Halococcus sp. IIIV-5B]RJT03032.1 bifunctional precorrin-2 dehydrogenase/sirohydrochlorin ferrochelatase [Halococcus sp. IIIV-5B]
MIPLLHDFTDATVLVFGGGRVGARKARRFAREARVVVVSPTFAEAEFGDVERVRAAPTPDDIPEWFDRTNPALAVAATDDDDLNDAVARAARERGSLLNRADRSRRGNESADGAARGERSREVVVPATVRDDPVVMAVATGGRSPALSRYLRERFETEFAGAGAMADLTGEIRTELRDRYPPEKRRAAVRAVVRSDRVWKALGDSSTNAKQEAHSVICDMLSGGDGR